MKWNAVAPKPCDVAFDKVETKFRIYAQELQIVGFACVRQAARDLARACRLFRDDEFSRLGAVIAENLRNVDPFKPIRNISEACHEITSRRRGKLNHEDPSLEDAIVLAAMNLEEACDHVLSDEIFDQTYVRADAVRSRVASEAVLQSKHSR